MTKNLQSRKNFLKTLGVLGSGLLLSNKIDAVKNTALYSPTSSQNPLRKQALRIAHLTDIHVSPGKVPEYGYATTLEEVNATENDIDFIINGGDAILNLGAISRKKIKEQWATFHHINKEHNSLPIHHCIGNHDIFSFALPNKNHDAGKLWTMDEYSLTKNYYSFSQNGWKFIVLDSIHGRNTIPGYYAKLDDEQYLWLEKELIETPTEIHICIVTHVPILAVCTMFDGSNHSNNQWRMPDNNLHADAQKLIELFYNFKNIKACLSGHIHLIDHVNYLGIDYYCNGAVSGSWWGGNYQQFAPSYSVMNFYSDGSCNREVKFYNWRKE
ncbi:MAG: metallophosphoesterase [Bacteroidetes bacterium]|nr:metallophosphoesterase [Bacteroidota bacterium]